MAANNLFYYSTNTRIAHHINEQFYNGKHYIWCSPVFNPSLEGRYSPYSKIPTSSNPHDIYCNFKKDVSQGDTHSDKIKANKRGLKTGATKQLARGVITQSEFGDIVKLIEKATQQDFTPFIYLIRADLVESRIERVPVKEAANPFGAEYRIFDLDRSEFEIMEVAI